MTKYEMLYLIDNDLSEETKTAEIAKYENIVKNLGGNVVSTDKWGVKKLSYPVNFKNEAYYVLMTFEAEGEVCKELTRVSGIDGDVMRCMITKIK